MNDSFPYPLPAPFLRLHRSIPLLALGITLLTAPYLRADTFSLDTIYTFTPATDGNVPYPALVQGADGNLYGTNSAGGKNDHGTVFSLTLKGGTFNVLSAFPETSGGSAPQGGVVQARDGNFYGTTFTGGSNGYGVLYQVTPGGTLTYLDSFNSPDPGLNPVGTLIEGVDGFLYGTAEYGGTDNDGTVYRATVPDGKLSTLAEITGGLAGTYPESDLIQATDGNFYGTTYSGGTSGNGTFFQVTPTGVYTALYSFTGDTDGGGPIRGVVQARDGAFYGVTTTGSTYASGAIYRIAVSGATATLTVLHTLVPALGEGSSADGGLLLASDGNLYGTTAMGGANLDGTIYRVTTTGGFATLYSFTDGADGAFPVGGLTEASDGRLYGTTAGQNGSAGTVFRVDLGLPAPPPQADYALQSSANVGDTILIKGNYFVGTTGVAFAAANSKTTAATNVAVLSKTIIRTVVPSGAVTGPITVTNGGGTGTTSVALTVNESTPTPTPTPTPVPTPQVTVVASDPVATKAGDNSGAYKVIRTGDKTQALTVVFKSHGTAIRGTDYNLVTQGQTLATVTNSVTIPAGVGKVKVKVVPVPSSVPGPDQTVLFQVKKGEGYGVGSPKKAAVEIAGNTGGS